MSDLVKIDEVQNKSLYNMNIVIRCDTVMNLMKHVNYVRVGKWLR